MFLFLYFTKLCREQDSSNVDLSFIETVGTYFSWLQVVVVVVEQAVVIQTRVAVVVVEQV